MVLPAIQYVTHPKQDFSSYKWVHNLHESGINWIQLRIKEMDFNAIYPEKHYQLRFMEIADELRMVTSALNMILTINDSVSIYNLSRADGIHVGMEDINPKEIVLNSPDAIIGVTANSIDEIKSYNFRHLSYLGVGPYYFTNTKGKIKPVLGLQGYKSILENMQTSDINLPVYAIGGITAEDIKPLRAIGVYGIAMSGEIFYNIDNKDKLTELVNLCKS